MRGPAGEIAKKDSSDNGEVIWLGDISIQPEPLITEIAFTTIDQLMILDNIDDCDNQMYPN